MYKTLTGWATMDKDIAAVLGTLKHKIVENALITDKCEIRLTRVIPPFSIIAVDSSKLSGSVSVEFQAYKLNPDQRLHILLSPEENNLLCDYYQNQFEEAWKDAEPVTDWNLYL
jgi:hypothetical protein